jgi:peptide/nickel transport system permease protein
VVVALTVLLPFVGLIAPHGEADIVAAPFQSPSGSHWLGTDDQGHDVLSRVLIGLRSSWYGALLVIAIGMAVGTLVGTIAAMAGGIVDGVLMRVTDAALALPGTLVALLVVASLGPSLEHTLVAVALTWWPWYCRLVRGQVRALSRLPHVDAARSSGMSRTRVVAVHVLPGVLGSLLVAASLDISGVMLVLASLSFLGLGAPPPAAEVGGMVADGLTYLFSAPWMALGPALVLFVVAAVANFAGDYAQEVVDR